MVIASKTEVPSPALQEKVRLARLRAAGLHDWCGWLSRVLMKSWKNCQWASNNIQLETMAIK